MRAGLIVTGVLGLGIALTFGAAALAATLLPNGATVHAWYEGGTLVDQTLGAPPNRGWIAPGNLPTGNTWGPGAVAEPDQGPALPGPDGEGSTAIGVSDDPAGSPAP
jgi:hypothetical protein